MGAHNNSTQTDFANCLETAEAKSWKQVLSYTNSLWPYTEKLRVHNQKREKSPLAKLAESSCYHHRHTEFGSWGAKLQFTISRAPEWCHSKAFKKNLREWTKSLSYRVSQKQKPNVILTRIYGIQKTVQMILSAGWDRDADGEKKRGHSWEGEGGASWESTHHHVDDWWLVGSCAHSPGSSALSCDDLEAQDGAGW